MKTQLIKSDDDRMVQDVSSATAHAPHLLLPVLTHLPRAIFLLLLRTIVHLKLV
jgi:hypothetical protein